MAEQLVNQLPPMWRPLKQAFIPQNLNQPSCINYQQKAKGNYYIFPQILNALTHFRGTTTEDPHLHLREFFDLCKLQHIQGLTPGGIRLVLFPWKIILSCGTIHCLQFLSILGKSCPVGPKEVFPSSKTSPVETGDSIFSTERWRPLFRSMGTLQWPVDQCQILYIWTPLNLCLLSS